MLKDYRNGQVGAGKAAGSSSEVKGESHYAGICVAGSGVRKSKVLVQNFDGNFQERIYFGSHGSATASEIYHCISPDF